MAATGRIRQAFRMGRTGIAAKAAAELRDEAAPAPARARATPARPPTPPRAASRSAQARPSSASAQASQTGRTSATAIENVDTTYLESLIGYNARRAALAVIAVFLERMKPYDLRPVDFSTLSLITHNPGITARQLCHALGILPPNMVGMINGFEKRGLIERHPHPTDRRAQGLHLTTRGRQMMLDAERTATELEQDVAHRLSLQEQRTLIGLLQKVYL